ncbi:MAG: hypothetical protein ACRBK7_30415 [Acidimicrobiales bacterium]
MAETPTVISVQDLEAMTAAERAAVFSDAMVTDLDLLDARAAAVVARGREKVLERLQTQE